MTWCFSGRNNIVVARLAGSGYAAMVETCITPAAIRMTVITGIAAPDVIDWFLWCDYAVMAQGALRWCAFKNSASVTRATLYEFMFPGQWEAGRKVIILPGWCC